MKLNSLTKIIAAFVVAAAFMTPSAHAASLQQPSGCIALSGSTCSFIASTSGLVTVAGGGIYSIAVDSTVCLNSTALSVHAGYLCNANMGQKVTVTVTTGLMYAFSYIAVPGQ